MTIDGSDQHLVILLRQFRLCYLHTLLTILFNPNLCERMLVPSALPKYMHMATIIINIK